MCYIKRDIEGRILKLASTFPALLVTGPRQTGKTTLLRHMYPEARYMTFDDPFLVMSAKGSPREFVAGLAKKQVILDEVQYVPELFRFLKMAIDEDRISGRFILTGSQNFQLGALGSESLAGRLAIIKLPTLGASELEASGLYDPGKHGGLDSLLFRGGFPELWSSMPDPADWYPAYINTYLQRDLRNISQVGNLQTFSRFLRALALRSGSLVNYADLARDAGTAPNTIKHWVAILALSGLVSLLEGWSSSLSSRLVKAPKVYFNDSGLLCSLLGLRSSAALKGFPLYGAVWESWCHGQLLTWLSNRGRLQENLYYWRTKEGKEVDLLLDEGGTIHAFECKARELPEASDGANLARLQAATPGVQIKGHILCKVDSYLPRIPGTLWDADDCRGFDRYLVRE